MRKINKKKIRYVFLLVSMFSLGMVFQYIYIDSKFTGEIEQLTNEIKMAKENNKQLEKEIVILHKEIAQYEEDKESSISTNKTSTSNTMDTTEGDTLRSGY
jgi:hypothetical protein